MCQSASSFAQTSPQCDYKSYIWYIELNGGYHLSMLTASITIRWIDWGLLSSKCVKVVSGFLLQLSYAYIVIPYFVQGMLKWPKLSNGTIVVPFPFLVQVHWLGHYSNWRSFHRNSERVLLCHVSKLTHQILSFLPIGKFLCTSRFSFLPPFSCWQQSGLHLSDFVPSHAHPFFVYISFTYMYVHFSFTVLVYLISTTGAWPIT